MRVSIKNFIITKSVGIGLYDIHRTYTIEKGKRKGQVVEKTEAWGIKLSRCFQIILDFEMEDKFPNRDVNVDEFLQIYREANESLAKEVQQLEVLLTKK